MSEKIKKYRGIILVAIALAVISLLMFSATKPSSIFARDVDWTFVPVSDSANAVANGDFESGTLSPWTSSTSTVKSTAGPVIISDIEYGLTGYNRDYYCLLIGSIYQELNHQVEEGEYLLFWGNLEYAHHLTVEINYASGTTHWSHIYSPLTTGEKSVLVEIIMDLRVADAVDYIKFTNVNGQANLLIDNVYLGVYTPLVEDIHIAGTDPTDPVDDGGINGLAGFPFEVALITIPILVIINRRRNKNEDK